MALENKAAKLPQVSTEPPQVSLEDIPGGDRDESRKNPQLDSPKAKLDEPMQQNMNPIDLGLESIANDEQEAIVGNIKTTALSAIGTKP